MGAIAVQVHKAHMKKIYIIALLITTLVQYSQAQRSRVELHWQTTSRGVSWYVDGMPEYDPIWKLSQDTNKVIWVDKLTSLRYDWSYLDQVWYTKGRASGAVPPLPTEINVSTTIDNRTAFWIRDTFGLLHKYDSTANAWTPIGDFFFLPSVPTNIAATSGNGAAIYTQSLWQDADDNVLYYFDGASWVPVGGDLSISNEIQTVTASGTTPNFSIDLDLGGGSVGIIEGPNMAISRSGNNLTFESTASGGITAADNGLTLSGSTVKLGGVLNQSATSIEQPTNNVFRWFGPGKWSVSAWTGYSQDPRNAKAGFNGLEDTPTLSSSPIINGILELNPYNSAGTIQSNSLTFGGYVTDSHGFWIQSRSGSNPGFEYPLSVQPMGGNFSIGRNQSFNVSEALATIAGIGLTGTGASGSVLQLEQVEGHGLVPLTFGAGADIIDAELTWAENSDAFRIINRGTNNNSSSIRFGFASQTGDLAAMVKSSNTTSKMKFAVGEGDPANIHSTIQSAGGYAGRVLTTVGSFTLDESNWVVIYTSSGSVTWTLPNPATCAGREYQLCSRGTGTVNIGGYSVSKGNGGNFTSLSAGQWAHIWSDGSGWTGYKITSE